MDFARTLTLSTLDRQGAQRSGSAGEVTLGHRFRVVRLLGGGGMGEVFEAVDTLTGTTVALKTIHPRIVGAPGVLERFRAELLLARRVTHQNVCRTFEMYAHEEVRGDPVQFLTMEFVAGETLRERLARSGPLPAGEAIPILLQVLDGLAAAHEAGVVHRDLKPSNVMLTTRGDGSLRVVITDFGIAFAGDEIAGRLSSERQLVGTPSYGAPEQLRGRPVSVAADVYSFGVLAFEALTGHSPESIGASDMHRGLDAEVGRVLASCLEKDPARRPATAIEVRKTLASAAGRHSSIRTRLVRTLKSVFLADDDVVLLQARVAGERLVAKTRLWLLGLLFLVQLAPQESAERLVGVAGVGVPFLASVWLYQLARRRYRPWLPIVSSLAEVTLVSTALASFLWLGMPYAATNSRVIFDVYYLVIIAAGLRFDWRLCLLASGAAAAQFFAISLYVATHFGLGSDEPLNRYGEFSWSSQYGRLVMLLTAGAAASVLALRAKRLRVLVGMDRLVGLPNRSSFIEGCDLAIQEAAGASNPIAVGLLDVTNLGAITLEGGPANGIRVLHASGERLRACARPGEILASLEGGAFAMAFPGLDRVSASARMDAFASCLTDLPLRISPTRLAVRSSLAEWPADGETAETLIERAEERLVHPERS